MKKPAQRIKGIMEFTDAISKRLHFWNDMYQNENEQEQRTLLATLDREVREMAYSLAVEDDDEQ
ncbi:MAG: hypothetical protein E6672_06285 [Negativicoccus succinicivorans]|nr:hypothetical protein [Negativicoccus succinicivorans]